MKTARRKIGGLSLFSSENPSLLGTGRMARRPRDLRILPPQAAAVTHFDARPLPNATAALGCAGGPENCALRTIRIIVFPFFFQRNTI